MTSACNCGKLKLRRCMCVLVVAAQLTAELFVNSLDLSKEQSAVRVRNLKANTPHLCVDIRVHVILNWWSNCIITTMEHSPCYKSL